jgi:hypothetical protein
MMGLGGLTDEQCRREIIRRIYEISHSTNFIGTDVMKWSLDLAYLYGKMRVRARTQRMKMRTRRMRTLMRKDINRQLSLLHILDMQQKKLSILPSVTPSTYLSFPWLIRNQQFSMEVAALTLANICLDVQIGICMFLHPSDILALRKVCRHRKFLLLRSVKFYYQDL